MYANSNRMVSPLYHRGFPASRPRLAVPGRFTTSFSIDSYQSKVFSFSPVKGLACYANDFIQRRQFDDIGIGEFNNFNDNRDYARPIRVRPVTRLEQVVTRRSPQQNYFRTGPLGFNHFATTALCSGPHCECVGSDSPLQQAKPIFGNFGIKLGFLSNSTYLAAILFFLVTIATYQTLEGSKRISYLYTFKITMGW